ncbi:4-(cytidine 5'-diphospho)-2-C-methyl-D-erythritol kinase [Gimesia algae]|uniref:4-diphosphocytidyl-2-C-methyl-D-erythritol kinase n=1 Tax=Gimesia algae TaxID=2527971 RepID=A0A517VJ73_9PLAN|nr:4-(cytidine 5'-diphospho)-2-C-methyl-D-erythritol kinase [Gimesia algae]QDT93050.1 4-diphosphocytidyl-2-C-methyl-D-erythritol kinase [Gimesia algae]
MLFAYSNPGTLIVHAPAKLNLYLSIDDKRTDGFHEITSLMLSVGIYDTLVFTEEPSAEVELRVAEANSLLTPQKNQQRIPAGEENLVVRAIRLLQEQTGQRQGIQIELIKRIPAEAGLGGGSSDAAAALFAANKLWRLGLSLSELCEIAAKLGSDIPFFLTASHSAICRGRGEIIEPVSVPQCLHFVVVRPQSGLSTADVYRHCRVGSHSKNQVEQLVRNLSSGQFHAVSNLMLNDLQAPAEKLNSDILKIKDFFSKQSVLGHMMSGSGTAYFGVCQNRAQASQIAARLRSTVKGHVFVVQNRL